MRFKFLYILIFSLFIVDAFSQVKKPKNKYVTKVKPGIIYNKQINYIKGVVGLGLSNYYGDLCDNFDCYKYRPNVYLGAYYRYDLHWSFRGEFNWFRMYGTDENGIYFYRNLNFRSNNFELSAVAIYDIFNYNRNFVPRKKITPYLFGGVGVLYFEPYGELDGKWHKLRPLRTEGEPYLPLTVTIPYGGGLRYKLTPLTDISFEVGYRKTFSDRIDDVSTVYIAHSDPFVKAITDKTVLLETSKYYKTGAPIGRNRGNPKRKDGFMNFGFKLEYKIKNTKQISRFSRVTPRFATVSSGSGMSRIFKKKR